jgi:hypothetical protein
MGFPAVAKVKEKFVRKSQNQGSVDNKSGNHQTGMSRTLFGEFTDGVVDVTVAGCIRGGCQDNRYHENRGKYSAKRE